MLKPLIIQCPEMGVNNTGSWWQFTADRRTEELKCRGYIGENEIGLSITFPPSRVYHIGFGRWMIEPVLAVGKLNTGEYLQISYPEEPIVRSGIYMMAQEVGSIKAGSYLIDKTGTYKQIWSKLPLARGSPEGFGLYRFIVEPVTLPGTIEE